MNQFVDNTGAAWSLSITLGAARRVKNKIGVDLLDPASKSSVGGVELPVSQRLLYDDLFLTDVVCSLLEPQFKERGVDKDAFLDRIDGSTLKRIDAVFWEEYRAFFEARGKEWAAKALTLDLETRQTAAQNALSQIDGSLSTDSPVELESTPID